MKAIFFTSLPSPLYCLIIVAVVAALSHAQPTFFLMQQQKGSAADQRAVSPFNSNAILVPHKRSFDRLERSAFDFGMVSKRYGDDDPSFDFYRKKKSFDRLDSSSFGSFAKRSFDRLDSSSFGFHTAKRSDKAAPALANSRAQPAKVLAASKPGASRDFLVQERLLHALTIAELLSEANRQEKAQMNKQQQQANEPTFLYYPY